MNPFSFQIYQIIGASRGTLLSSHTGSEYRYYAQYVASATTAANVSRPGEAPPNTVSRRTVAAVLADQFLTAIPRHPVDVYVALMGSMGQARFSLEKQKGNPGAASVPLGPSGHPKLSDGRVAAGGGARLAAVGANSATVAVSSPALSAPVRRAAGPARRQTSEIQVVLKRCRKTRYYYTPYLCDASSSGLSRED